MKLPPIPCIHPRQKINIAFIPLPIAAPITVVVREDMYVPREVWVRFLPNLLVEPIKHRRSINPQRTLAVPTSTPMNILLPSMLQTTARPPKKIATQINFKGKFLKGGELQKGTPHTTPPPHHRPGPSHSPHPHPKSDEKGKTRKPLFEDEQQQQEEVPQKETVGER